MKQNADIPKGYKNSPLGIIPDEWEVKKLGEIGHFLKGKGVPKDKITTEGYKCLTYGDIYTKYNVVMKNVQSFIDEETALTSAELMAGDILIAGSGATSKEIGKSIVYQDSEKAYAGRDIIIFRQKIMDALFLAYVLNGSKSKSQKYKMGQGHSVVHIYSSQLENLLVTVPPLPEQRKIAEILSTCDSAIDLQTQLITLLETRKRVLMRQLMTGKKRLKEFHGKWKKYPYEKLLKTVERPVVWDDNERYKLISVSRHSGGIFFREELYGHEIKVKDLRTVEEGDFIFSKRQIVHGASAMVDQRFAGSKISDSYIAVVPKNADILNIGFFNYFSQQKYFCHQAYISSYGVHGETMTFDFGSFLQLEIKLPPIVEQCAISLLIATADMEIVVAKCKLSILQAQKKGLMQVLLTGKKRVNT